MIYVHRKATIAPGKIREAVGWSVGVAAHAAKVIGTPVEVVMPLGANFFDIGWKLQYDDLAALEQGWAKLYADAGYMEMLGRAADLFVAGTAREEIWQTVG